MALTYDDGSGNGSDNPYGYPDPVTSDPAQSAFTGFDQAAAQIQAWYRGYLGRDATPDEIASQKGNPGGLQAVQQLIMNSPEAHAFASQNPGQLAGTGSPLAPQAPPPVVPTDVTPPAEPTVPTPPPAGPVAPPVTPSPPTGPDTPGAPAPTPAPAPPSDPGTVRNIVDTIPQSFYQAPAAFSYPDYVSTYKAPTWTALADFSYPQYVLPTGQEVLAQDPGYDFRKSEANRAITNNASMTGLLRSTATAKALEDYDSSLASQEYGAAVSRGTGIYGMNRANAAQDYDRLWRNMLTDYGVKDSAAQETEAANKAAYDANFKTAATKQGFNLDAAAGVAGGKQGATSLAGNLTLGAGNLALNQSNSTFGNLLDLYKLSTANLPTYQSPAASTFN